MCLSINTFRFIRFSVFDTSFIYVDVSMMKRNIFKPFRILFHHRVLQQSSLVEAYSKKSLQQHAIKKKKSE